MLDQSATDYLRNLSDLMQSVQVTDSKLVARSLDEGAREAVGLILSARAAAAKAMLIGNGGSASIASHIQNDLCKAVGVRTLVFNEQPLLTALGNDHGYGCIFEQPLQLWTNAGDLLF